jgi:hypothetical protein
VRVDRDVKGRTRGYAHSLAWADWKWRPRTTPLLADQVLVFLYEVDVNRVVNQLAFLEDFRKVPLRIHVTNGLNQLDIGDIGLQNSYAAPYNTGNGRCFTYYPGKRKAS